MQRLVFVMGWELARRRAHGTLVLNGCGQMLGGTRVTGSDAGRMGVRESTAAAQRWMLPRVGEASGRGGFVAGPLPRQLLCGTAGPAWLDTLMVQE